MGPEDVPAWWRPMPGWTKFTEPAQHVMVLAEQQALADGDPAISTGDILLGLLHADRGVAASALESLGITVQAVRRQLEEIPRDVRAHEDHENGASEVYISGRITFTRNAAGLLSLAWLALSKTGHNARGQPRTPQGFYLCTGEILVAMFGMQSGFAPVLPDDPEAVVVLDRLGVYGSDARDRVIYRVRRSPADERWPLAQPLP